MASTSGKGAGLTTKDGKPALKVQVPADLKKASKKGEVK
jgi:hypothetical protein